MLLFINTFFYTSLCFFKPNNDNNLITNNNEGTMNCSISNIPVHSKLEEESFRCFNNLNTDSKSFKCISKNKHAKCLFENFNILSDCRKNFESCGNIIFNCTLLENDKDSSEETKKIKPESVIKLENTKFDSNLINLPKSINFKKEWGKEKLFLKFGHLKNPVSTNNFEVIGLLCVVISIISFVYLFYIVVLMFVKWEEQKIESFI
uniref:Phlebovirus glycoprotein G2 fusion domain-containing protein n=1 Tax=Strongyloides stercoralis TaxID=6248 RepID=A0A0K0EPT6_STRER